MVYILVLLLSIFIFMIIVRIGAVALQMTGMDPEIARFQSLSAFSGTGFTTREAEEVVRHRGRRRIVTVLIILGNGGLVTVIAAVVASVASEQRLPYPYNLLALVAVGLALYLAARLLSWHVVARYLDRLIENQLRDRPSLAALPMEELFHLREGWEVAQIEIGPSSSHAGTTLAEANLRRAHGVSVLAIEREGGLVSMPDGTDTIEAGDLLLCYGRSEDLEAFAGRGGASRRQAPS